MHTDIELPVRTSVACHWRRLSEDIQDALFDAIHHPEVLNGSLQPCLKVEITANLLLPDPYDCDMHALNRLLVSGCIYHLFQCHQETLNAHCISIRLSPFADRDMSQIVESLPITHNPKPKPVRRTNMSISNLHQPQSHNNRSIPMNNIPRKLKKKSWFARFFAWLFEPAETVEKQRGEPVVEPIDASSQIAPCDSYLEAFHQALTQATADYIRRQVEPIHREEHAWRYSIRTVKVGMTEATRPCLEALETLPLDLRNRIAKIRMGRAHAAAEQLLLDNFFGIIIEADKALLEGPVVQTLISYNGQRFQLNFLFDGDWIEVPAETQPATVNPQQPVIPDFADAGQTRPRQRDPVVTDDDSLIIGTRPRENPKHLPRIISAKLTIKLPDGSDTITLTVDENQLPYTIGRAPQGHGYKITSADEAAIATVSRKHLILERFDIFNGHCYVHNCGSNGTFDGRGQALPQRFIHVCGTNWLSLGGTEEAESVQIALEF